MPRSVPPTRDNMETAQPSRRKDSSAMPDLWFLSASHHPRLLLALSIAVNDRDIAVLLEAVDLEPVHRLILANQTGRLMDLHMRGRPIGRLRPATRSEAATALKIELVVVACRCLDRAVMDMNGRVEQNIAVIRRIGVGHRVEVALLS